MAPCDARGRPLGPAVPVIGEVLPDAEHAVAERALSRRYGVAFGAMGVVGRIQSRGRAPQRAFMAFRPGV